jgi:cobalt-zinc-cadmium efflux system membrane fusion protein
MKAWKLNRLRQRRFTFLDMLGVVLLFVFLILTVTWFSSRGPAVQTPEATINAKKVIHLPPGVAKDFSIGLTQLKKIKPLEEVVLPGRVQKDLTQTGVITGRTQGKVIEVTVNESDPVKKDQVLAVIQSNEVAQAESLHLKSLVRFELTRRQWNRSRELFEHEIIPAREHEVAKMEYLVSKSDLDASRIQLQTLGLHFEDIHKLEMKQLHLGELVIRSPIEGWILERNVGLGQYVQPSDTLFSVGKVQRVWIVLDVYEKDISLISKGMKAEVSIPRGRHQQDRIQAVVSRISHMIDPATRTADVWLEVSNIKQDLKFGQAVTARIHGLRENQNLASISALPLDAVHQMEGKSMIFVKKGDLTFEARKVETGLTSDQWVEIKAGLKAGEEVASAGSFILEGEFLKS